MWRLSMGSKVKCSSRTVAFVLVSIQSIRLSSSATSIAPLKHPFTSHCSTLQSKVYNSMPRQCIVITVIATHARGFAPGSSLYKEKCSLFHTSPRSSCTLDHSEITENRHSIPFSLYTQSARYTTTCNEQIDESTMTESISPRKKQQMDLNLHLSCVWMDVRTRPQL